MAPGERILSALTGWQEAPAGGSTWALWGSVALGMLLGDLLLKLCRMPVPYAPSPQTMTPPSPAHHLPRPRSDEIVACGPGAGPGWTPSHMDGQGEAALGPKPDKFMRAVDWSPTKRPDTEFHM